MSANQKCQSGTFDSTAERLAQQHGVSRRTINRDGAFASDVETVQAIDPTIPARIAKGTAPKKAQIIEAAQAVREHNPKQAEAILNGNGTVAQAQRTVAGNEKHSEANGNGKPTTRSHHKTKGEGTPAARSRLSDQTRTVIETLADGTLRSNKQAIKFLKQSQIEITNQQLMDLTSRMVHGRIKTDGYIVERERFNGEPRFRIRKVESEDLKPVPLLRIKDFLNAVTPLLKEAIIQTDKSEYMVSPNAILFRLRSIERLFDALREELKAK